MTKSPAPDDCPLCGIAQGRLPALVVYEEPRFLAVLDSNPIRPGHLRIIPRAHYPCFNALPPDLAAALLDLASASPRSSARSSGSTASASCFPPPAQV